MRSVIDLFSPQYDFVSSVDDEFQKLNLPYASKRWEKMCARLALYGNETSEEYEQLVSWKDKPGETFIERKLTNVQNALMAVRELDHLNLDIDSKAKIKTILMQYIDVQLNRLEHYQINQLAEIQTLSRKGEIKALNKEYEESRKNIDEEVNEKKLKALFKKIEDLPQDQTTNLRSVANKLNSISIIWKKHLKRIGILHDVVSPLGSVSSLVRTTGIVLPRALAAIPVVNALTVSIPLILKAIRTWTSKQSRTTKAWAAVGAVLVTGSLVAAGLVPIAAASIVAGLVGVGVYKLHYEPWRKTLDLKNQKKSQIFELNKVPEDSSILTQFEKNCLLNNLEAYVLTQTNDEGIGRKAKAAFKLIVAGKRDAVSNNELIIAMLKGTEFKRYLDNQKQTHTDQLNKEIKALETKESRQYKQVNNGIVAFVGALLMAVPFPPTMILGAAMLVGTTFTGLGMEYSVIDKMKSGFRKMGGWFTGKKQEDESVKDAPTSTLTDTNTKTAHFEHSSTATILSKGRSQTLSEQPSKPLLESSDVAPVPSPTPAPTSSPTPTPKLPQSEPLPPTRGRSKSLG
jgi:VIT1/CCC1 family predicted Fe2+/Mn2+ transporter